MSLNGKAVARCARIAVLGLAAFAASCTAGGVVYEAHTVPVRPGPPSRPDQVCTREFAPVCGERRGDRRTFPNACVADTSGFRVAYGGECRRGPQSGPRPGFGPGPSRPPQSDRFCTREFKPVCARRGGRERTFPNACEADNAGFRIVDRGPC
ncbi:peptidase [Tianweitania sp. BSSL-BM11]|uniref:Peptidase n=1 Tax=Tianweitania aestuarii TaxID=2814886 RepID=A0ABS5RQM2_9HYPH|nr:Kazal-type serine protease inhibitor domain-containing protein [Tianweitania aestuarii]MBS9719343.1 peptidase [Tianweitania aestuarii]